MAKLKLLTVLTCLFVALLLGPTALAQQPAAPPSPAVTSPEAQLLRALLEEVRQLRTELQRTSVNTHRAQMLAERLVRQQSLVESLSEEIEQLKALIQQSQDTSREEGELKELETAIQETPDPQVRQQLAQSYASLKRSFARQKEYAQQEAERQRQRQQQLETMLRAEQVRLAEMQEQLDALDRDLERQIAESRKIK